MNKFAGILNIVSGLIEILLYVGAFFTFIMAQIQESGIADCLVSVSVAAVLFVLLAFLIIPAFMMFVVGREMVSKKDAVETEKILLGLTMVLKFLFGIVFACVGLILFIGKSEYYWVYGLCLLLGAFLFVVSFVADICALIKNKIHK